MENNCSIINDLIPLCAEGIASEDAVKLVEEHIESCEECRAAYDEVKSASGGVNDEGDEVPLKEAVKIIRNLVLKYAAAFALVVFGLLLVVFSGLVSKQYIPYYDGLITVEELSDGRLNVDISNATGCDTTFCWTSDEPAEGEMPDYVQIMLWTTRWNALTSQSGVMNKNIFFELDGIKAIDYCDCANDGELVRVYGEPADGGSVVLERLVLGAYLIFAIIGAVILGVLWLIFRKRPAGKIFRSVFFIPVAYIVAHLSIMGFNSATYAAGDRFIFILLVAASYYSAYLIAKSVK